jgi:hypothetical protein
MNEIIHLFDILTPREYLPAYVNTVLLPFKGKITYDGLMQNHRVHFGSGIRGRLKETYLTAKQNGRIIESLDAPAQTEPRASGKPKRPDRDWRAEVEAIRKQAEALQTGAATPAIQGAVFKLVKASLELAWTSTHQPDNLSQLRDQTRKVELALQKVQTTIHRAG